MNNIRFRRTALSICALCSAVSVTLLLICSIVYPKLIQTTSIDIFKNADVTDSVFPLRVSGTQLLIENFVSYDGEHTKNGQILQVMDAAAIAVRNTGEETVLFAQILLDNTKQTLLFEATMLPPGSLTLIPEKNYSKAAVQTIKTCSGFSVSAPTIVSDYIQIVPVDMSLIEVTNVSNYQLKNLRLYHKTYLSDSDIFIGAIATETVISSLAPGETICVQPEFFARDYCKFVYME